MEVVVGMISDILVNVIADIIFWLGLGIIVCLAVRIAQFRFMGFFGLKTHGKLIVYLSNLWQPTAGNPKSCVLSGHEFRVTRSINSLFGETPFRLPSLVRGLVDSFWIREKLSITVEASPPTTKQVKFTDMIVVGATPKNNVRRYYLGAGLPYLAIVGEQAEPLDDVFRKVLTSRVRVMKGEQKGKDIPGEYNFAIVEKICDEEHGTTVFMCAGFRGDSSWAATEYLVRNWRKLQKKFGNKAFAVCLGFPWSEEYLDTYEEPKVVASFPI